MHEIKKDQCLHHKYSIQNIQITKYSNVVHVGCIMGSMKVLGNPESNVDMFLNIIKLGLVRAMFCNQLTK